MERPCGGANRNMLCLRGKAYDKARGVIGISCVRNWIMGSLDDVLPTLSALNAHAWMQCLHLFDGERCPSELGVSFRTGRSEPVLNQVFLHSGSPCSVESLLAWVSEGSAGYIWNIPPHQEDRDAVISRLRSLGLVERSSYPQFVLSLPDLPLKPTKICPSEV